MNDDKFSRVVSAAPLPRTLVALAALIFVESAILAVVAGFLVYELFTEVPTSLASAIGMLVLVIAAAAWLVAIGMGAVHARPWVRAAALTWQVLQLAVAVGSFQGLFARDDIGWFLLVPALAVIALLFTRSVMSATARTEDGDRSPED